jgi:putative transposase
LRQHRPAIHHADPGVQDAATTSIQTLRGVGAQSRMAAVGEAAEHGDAEPLMRTIKAEEVPRNAYADFQAAYQPRGRCLADVYQRNRSHSALGYLTPEEFETQGLHKQPRAMAVQLEAP